MQIAPILEQTKEYPGLYRFLFVMGLIFDYDLPSY